MKDHPERPRDLNQWAKHMVDLVTGKITERDPDAGKDRAAVELDDVIRDRVAFGFRQTNFEAAHDLVGARSGPSIFV